MFMDELFNTEIEITSFQQTSDQYYEQLLEISRISLDSDSDSPSYEAIENNLGLPSSGNIRLGGSFGSIIGLPPAQDLTGIIDALNPLYIALPRDFINQTILDTESIWDSFNQMINESIYANIDDKGSKINIGPIYRWYVMNNHQHNYEAIHDALNNLEPKQTGRVHLSVDNGNNNQNEFIEL